MLYPMKCALLFTALLSAIVFAGDDSAGGTPQDIAYRESLARLKGKPGAPEIETALSALADNAAKGHLPSELFLAQSFYMGTKAIPQDYKRAFPHIRAAALRNDPWAMNAFASMHEFGQGTEINPGLALDWYRQAAMSGHPRAMANMGRILVSRPANSGEHIEGCAWLYLSRDFNDGVGSRTLALIEAKIPAGNVPKIEALRKELRELIQAKTPSPPAAPEE